MKNIRYAWPLLGVGTVSGMVVLAVETIGTVPVAEANHLGFVQLGHFNTADGTTEIDNTAPAGGDGRALHVRGSPSAGGVGLKAVGQGDLGVGVLAYSWDDEGVVGFALGPAPPYSGAATNGVSGHSWNSSASGVIGRNGGGGYGVSGWSSGAGGIGVYGDSPGGSAVFGVSYGGGPSGTGVVGLSDEGDGVYGFSSTGYAGHFNGDVHVVGTLSKGAGAFKIDHPLDPANKYLYHSFVESPDMKTIYDGVVVLDDKGQALLELPAWFEALNRDFRYQLTAIGASAPNLHIAQKVLENRFKIAGGPPGLEVSWQVTGIRYDPYAEQHRIPVEEQKSAEERGKYLYPKEYGQPETMGINYVALENLEKKQVETQEHHMQREQLMSEALKRRKEIDQREDDRQKYFEEMEQSEARR